MAKAAMKTKIMLEIFIVLASLVFSPVATTLEWFDASDSAALCNDFTRAGYFLRRVNTSDKWIIHLESGGVCYSNETCNRRFFAPEASSRYNRPVTSQPEFYEIYYGNFDPAEAWTETVLSGKEAAVDVVSPLMTSMRCFENKTEYFPRGLSVNGTDILDSDCEDNPLFCDYNHVVVPYCSSDIWLGTEIDGVRNNTAASRECRQCFDYNQQNGCFRYNPRSESIQFTYRGRTIFMSVIRDLLAMGMDGAAEVVLAGSSAGGLGALNNAKWLQSELQSVGSAELIVILDSAWFINFQGNIYREFDGTINRAESEAQRQNVLTLLSLLGSDEACSDVRLGYPCCFSPHCLLLQKNAAGERYYPEVPTFAIFSLYDIYLLAPSLVGLETLENEGEISIGYGIDFLLTVGEYGGEMNNTVITTAAQANFFSYYATQCFQHVYLATSTLWGEPGSSVFGTSSVELQRDLASFSLSVESGMWRSLQLAGPSIQEALTRWYYNRTETVSFRDNCGGPHCNMECPERFMLTELNSNNWPLGVKFLISLTVVFITASCGILKIWFLNWLHKENKANDDSELMTDEPHDRLKYMKDFTKIERKGTILSCRNLSYAVETSYSTIEDKDNDDTAPYYILDKVIPQLKRTDVPLTVDNICSRIGEVDSTDLGYQLRIPHSKRYEIEKAEADPTRATIEYWLSIDPKPSWRKLIMALLEQKNTENAVGNVEKCVEQLTDDSLTIENISNALVKLKDFTILCGVLSVPISKQNQIRRKRLSEPKQRDEVMKWWLKNSPNASWTTLAGRLYFREKRTTLDSVKQHLKKSSDSSLTSTNLWQTLQGVTEWWGRNGLCHYLDIPNPVQQEVRKQIADATQQKEALLRRWLRDHPAPSWEIVADAVYMIGELDVLKQLKMYKTGRSLMVPNIINKLKGVDCMKEKGLGYQLRVPHHVLSHIKKQHSSQADQTTATVEYWLRMDPKPSWRRLMMALQYSNQHKAVKNVKPYIEPLADPSLTASNVCTALEALSDLDKVCDVPLHRQNLIRIQHTTETKRRQAVVEWWLQQSPHASWKWLAGQLYYYEEWTALEAVLQYMKASDSTLPSTKSLQNFTEDVYMWGARGLRLHLQVPYAVEEEIYQQTDDATEQKKILLERWLKEHPAPSWAVVTEALYQMEKHDVLEKVKMYITGRSLNIHNLSRQLENVDCMNLGLGHHLKIPDLKCCEIKVQHTTPCGRTRAMIEYWLSVDPTPSWRRFLVALEENEQHAAAKCVTPYAEEQSDPNLTDKRVLGVLEAVKDVDIVFNILAIPFCKQNEIWHSGKDESERRQKLVEWWLSYSPFASWTWLAGQLYCEKQEEALQRVKEYIPKKAAALDPTLTLANLWEALHDVQDFSKGLCKQLKINIQKETSINTKQKKKLLKKWLEDHPAASWAVVEEALYQMKEHEVLKKVKTLIAGEKTRIRQKPMKITSQTKKILHGISTSFKPSKVTAIMGSSGCGKSTFLDLLTGRRHSSGVIIDDEYIHGQSESHVHNQSGVIIDDECTDDQSESHAHNQSGVIIDDECTDDQSESHAHNQSGVIIDDECTDDQSESHTHNQSGVIIDDESTDDLSESHTHNQSGVFIDNKCIDDKSNVREWYFKHTSYVLQLAAPYYEELTVLENLRFSAVLSLSGEKNEHDLLCYVNDIMKLTGLHKHAKTHVGGTTGPGLSGGQKRRLLLALQLLTQPNFVILDEPLSGLDSGSAYKLLVFLKELAQNGRTVILTVHRPGPELFSLFDNILLLYRGKIAYEGTSADMHKTFMDTLYKCYEIDKTKLITEELDTNYAFIEEVLKHDRMLDLITKEHQNKRKGGATNESPNEYQNPHQRPSPFKSSTKQFWHGQFGRLAALEARASKRTTGVWQTYFPVVFFMYGLLLGTVYLQQTIPLLIMSGFAAFSFASSLVMFPMLNRYYLKALEVYQYERWDALAWSHDIVVQGFCRAISLAALPVVICAGILYLLLVNAESYNLFVFLQLLVVNLALNQTWTALTIALMCAFTEQAVHISTVIVSVAGFTAGFFIPIEQIPWWYRWLSYINPNYYGFSASSFLLLNDFETDCTGTPFECFTSSGEYVLGQFSFEKINPYVNISILLLFTLVGLLLAWFSMWWNYNITCKWKEDFKNYVKDRLMQASIIDLSCFRGCCSQLLFCYMDRKIDPEDKLMEKSVTKTAQRRVHPDAVSLDARIVQRSVQPDTVSLDARIVQPRVQPDAVSLDIMMT